MCKHDTLLDTLHYWVLYIKPNMLSAEIAPFKIKFWKNFWSWSPISSLYTTPFSSGATSTLASHY